MPKIRTHHCGELNKTHEGQRTKLMGWAQTIRRLGGLIFVDLRDHHGITQVVVLPETSFFEEVEKIRQESVVSFEGVVNKREGAANTKIATGEMEVVADHFYVESSSDILPFPIVNNTKLESEETRLRYRFLDLRTTKMQHNTMFYNHVIAFLRRTMWSLGFTEFQTPILTSSSPEGARDFLVPSRLHPGKFYALPQAPQQFKQILMCSGFDKYFQIAPCFRDEDPRADRAPGEFYQLDLEVAFADQDLILSLGENIVRSLFGEFGKHKKMPEGTFHRLTWHEAQDKYGSDKPDLRFDMPMHSVNHVFEKSAFGPFQKTLEANGTIKAIVLQTKQVPSRKFFDELDVYAKETGLGGIPWLTFQGGDWKGSCAKQISDSEKQTLLTELSLTNDQSVVFILGTDVAKTLNSGGKIRTWLGSKLDAKDNSKWALCWVVDFPFYEWNEDEQKIDFCHNPFSMPQGGSESLNTKNPLSIKAFQYDLVCNGFEVSSGAIRNHRRDTMLLAFEKAGYTETEVQEKFGALWNAFQFGAPPHGGMAFGLARLVMILLEEPNIREVLAFPMNGKAMDVMMGAPSEVDEKQLNLIHVKLAPPKKI